MQPGVVKIADENDFNMLRTLMDDHTDWRLKYYKQTEAHMKIWTKPTNTRIFSRCSTEHGFRRPARSRIQEVLGRTYDRLQGYRWQRISAAAGMVRLNTSCC
ncbi:unnamed protein product [Acanthoscelides obtectus]|uniref:Uncharacterized protein n=1 Tax=Acanthoscelides obtectus TaxID=200917 RepID=A0A9P0K4K5_ACAOB|nr:unnamed protein product [Acanthoscelides obtectus]CAK1633239.1 hypothetical protein AOBTE_LOCUS8001 [Acanthoscelides obtectus]